MKTNLNKREFNFKNGAENVSKCFAPYLQDFSDVEYNKIVIALE